MKRIIYDRTGNTSMQLIINDLTKANPNVSKEMIVFGLQSVVDELLPVIVSRVKHMNALSPLQEAIRNFRDQRRRKKNTQKRTTTSEALRAINSAKATLQLLNPMSDKVSFSRTQIEAFDSGTDLDTYIRNPLIGNTTRTQTTNMKFSQTGTSYLRSKEIGFGSQTKSYGLSKDVFELDISLRNKDMDTTQGIFLSSIERSVREFVLHELSLSELQIEEPIVLAELGEQFVLRFNNSKFLPEETKQFIVTVINNSVRHNLKFIEDNLETQQKLALDRLNKALIIEFNEIVPNSINEVKQLPLSNKQGKDEMLTFYDIKNITFIISKTENIKIIRQLNTILKKDLSLRNHRFKVNCTSELYRGEELIPKNMSLKKPNRDDLMLMVEEAKRAIILNEFNLRTKEERAKFLQNKISHKEYIDNIDNYTKIAIDVW